MAGVMLFPATASDFSMTTMFSCLNWLPEPHLQPYSFTAKVILSPLKPSFS